jgi:[ribosomal protein S18]-alanine N-acetyltransferase
VLIRELRQADFERLHAIDQAAFAPELAYSRSELRHYLAASRGGTLVAELGGNVAGFVVALHDGKEAGTVITLDVAPECQRRGVGGALLVAAEAWLERRGARRIGLETPADESGARQFYEKHGYLVVARRRGYYHGRLDAFRMVKELV